MSDYFRPLLGAKLEGSLMQIRLPAFVSYKVDGWRGIWQGLEYISRSGKNIPNRALRSFAVQNVVPVGWDGEIIVGDPFGDGVFSRTDKFCKKMDKAIPPEGVRFFVFDNINSPHKEYWRRLEELHDLSPLVVKLDQELVETYDRLIEIEEEAVAKGYEGICTRNPLGPYKHGRSTMKEQYLVKVKRYLEEEVRIEGAVEKQHNANPAFISEGGYTKRSSHKDGKAPAGTLGALIVNWRGNELRVGSGWDRQTAAELWALHLRGELHGRVGTVRFSPPTKDLPRQPIWKGLRHDL